MWPPSPSLNEQNEIIHKIETSVMCKFIIDDSYEVRIERKLLEDWKALGMPNEQLKGTIQQRFFNDVPLTVAEFEAKLNSIANLELWLMLSNINTFMALKKEERRKILMLAVDGIDEVELAKGYPAIIKAITTEKKTIDELQIQTASTRKRANEELKTIPSQISAQDRLIISYNFDELQAKKEEAEKEIKDIDIQLEGSPEDLATLNSLRVMEQSYLNEINDKLNEIQKEHRNLIKDKDNELTSINAEIRSEEDKLQTAENKNKANIDKLTQLQEKFNLSKEEWMKVNDESFSFSDEAVCPTCGHKFTEEESEIRKNKAVEQYNLNKSKRLEQLQNDASIINAQIIALRLPSLILKTA